MPVRVQRTGRWRIAGGKTTERRTDPGRYVVPIVMHEPTDAPVPSPQFSRADDRTAAVATDADSTRLVLLGDMHLYRLAVAPWQLLSKRLVGQLNLWLNRRRQFDRDLLPAVIKRADSLSADFCLLSGDLTTTALAGEFEDAAAAIRPLLQRGRTVIVPGNHDRYVQSAVRRHSIERRFAGFVPERFPFLKQLGKRWHLLAIDAATPHTFSSRGRVGGPQLDAARRAIKSLDDETGLIVLCHYPFAVPPHVHWPRGHRLADASGVATLIRQASAKCRQVLYLHGHVHQPWHWRPHGHGDGRLMAVNAGSPCRRSSEHPRGQGFWQIELPADAADPIGLFHHQPSERNGQTIWNMQPVT